jgi:hypothetical protein
VTIIEMTRETVRVCTAGRHEAEHQSFVAGCRCPDTVEAEIAFRNAATGRPRSAVKKRCKARRHTATNDAYRHGCRCEPAIAAHQRHLDAVREERNEVFRTFYRTGECTARSHNTRHANHVFGCQCPRALELADQSLNRASRATDHKIRKLRPVVDQGNLLLLLAGVKDNPTAGEYMAADIRLQRVRVPDGPLLSRPLTTMEISERLGVHNRIIFRVRKDRLELRARRAERRLADVRAKAARVARARSRVAG